MRMIIKRELRTGIDLYDIVEADCGAAAMAAVRSGGVDLVLSDWNMPEMTGIELLESLRRESPSLRAGA
jgi:two-component system chemotaxis response regulator CheY